MDGQYPYRNRDKFVVPDSNREVVNPYDQDSRLFQDLVQRKYEPVFVVTLDFSQAGSLHLPVSGFHFVVYGHDGQPNKGADTSVLVNVSINQQSAMPNPYPAKNARGYSGPFAQLYLEWPQQLNMGEPRFADFIIYKGWNKPWIDGEACT